MNDLQEDISRDLTDDLRQKILGTGADQDRANKSAICLEVPQLLCH